LLRELGGGHLDKRESAGSPGLTVVL
jgi:hypothetical protein